MSQPLLGGTIKNQFSYSKENLARYFWWNLLSIAVHLLISTKIGNRFEFPNNFVYLCMRENDFESYNYLLEKLWFFDFSYEMIDATLKSPCKSNLMHSNLTSRFSLNFCIHSISIRSLDIAVSIGSPFVQFRFNSTSFSFFFSDQNSQSIVVALLWVVLQLHWLFKLSRYTLQQFFVLVSQRAQFELLNISTKAPRICVRKEDFLPYTKYSCKMMEFFRLLRWEKKSSDNLVCVFL